MTISKVADWITIITGPLTVLSMIAAWLGKLGQLARASQQGSITTEIFAILLIVLAWCFFFFAQLRIFIRLHRALSDVAMFLMSILVALIGLCLFIAVESLLLHAMVPSSSWGIIWLVWIILPVTVWCIASYIAINIIAAGAWEKDAN